MKKIIVCIILALASFCCAHSQDVWTPIIDTVECHWMDKNELYSNIMYNWPKLNDTNHSQNTLYYFNKEQGIIQIRAKIYIGSHKSFIKKGISHNGFVDAFVTYYIGNNMYEIELTTNKIIIYIWTGTGVEYIYITKEIYPAYFYDVYSNRYLEVIMKYLQKELPNIIDNYLIECKEIHKN